MRTQRLVDGAVSLVAGSSVRLHFDTADGIAREFDPGDLIDIDFHGARLRVTAKKETFCEGTVEIAGKIGGNKAVSVDRSIELPAMTEKDKHAVEVGRRCGIRHFALSFAGSVEDVREFRSCIGHDAHLISKIENIKGMRCLEGIADQSDAILIDRGDLSREVPINQIPFLQRRLVATVKSRLKPVYVATNLLESMIEWHQPNRAVVNDVVSTLEMGATGLVLAAETAIGDHPLAAVQTIYQLVKNFRRWTPNTSFDELLSMD